MDPYRKVQPGERLKVPARAWNELMGGLGVRPEFGAGPSLVTQYAIVVPIKLTTAPEVSYEHVGVPIKLTDVAIFGSVAIPAGISLLTGQIAEPTDLRGTTLLPAPEMFGLTVEPMRPGENGTTVVRCAIKGLAIARVRQFASSDRYVALPTRRADSETVESLRGTLETSAAGYGRLVKVISEDFCLVSI